jgi:hypothetical protein
LLDAFFVHAALSKFPLEELIQSVHITGTIPANVQRAARNRQRPPDSMGVYGCHQQFAAR